MIRFNYYFGAAVSAWLLTILVIIVELSASFKVLLTSIFTHHWIAKLVIITIAFIVFGFALKDKKAIGKCKDESVAWFSMLASVIIIFLFYIIEFLV